MEGLAGWAENGEIAKGRFSRDREQKLRFLDRKKQNHLTLWADF